MASMDAEALATELRGIRKELKDMSLELSSIRRALHGGEKPGIAPELALIRKTLEQIADA